MTNTQQPLTTDTYCASLKPGDEITLGGHGVYTVIVLLVITAYRMLVVIGTSKGACPYNVSFDSVKLPEIPKAIPGHYYTRRVLPVGHYYTECFVGLSNGQLVLLHTNDHDTGCRTYPTVVTVVDYDPNSHVAVDHLSK